MRISVLKRSTAPWTSSAITTLSSEKSSNIKANTKDLQMNNKDLYTCKRDFFVDMYMQWRYLRNHDSFLLRRTRIRDPYKRHLGGRSRDLHTCKKDKSNYLWAPETSGAIMTVFFRGGLWFETRTNNLSVWLKEICVYLYIETHKQIYIFLKPVCISIDF